MQVFEEESMNPSSHSSHWTPELVTPVLSEGVPFGHVTLNARQLLSFNSYPSGQEVTMQRLFFTSLPSGHEVRTQRLFFNLAPSGHEVEAFLYNTRRSPQFAHSSL